MQDDRFVTSIRATRAVVEQLKLLREELQARQQFGRVTLENAITFAVSSASAALHQQQARSRDGPS